MSDFNYDNYAELFNTGDDEKLCHTFFTSDAVMQTADRTIEGRAALLDFLKHAHDGVREIIHPQLVMHQGNHVFAEINMEFKAYENRPDFVFQVMKKGESIFVKFFAIYTLRGNKICFLKAARWPVGYAI